MRAKSELGVSGRATQLPARLNDLKAEGVGQRCRLLRCLAAINPEGGTGNGDCVGRDIAAAFVLLVDHHFGTSLEEVGHLSTTLRKNLCNVVSLGNFKTHGEITHWKRDDPRDELGDTDKLSHRVSLAS